MSEYKYRDKVSGQWIAKAVCEGKILEFVTRGTLTPYDFVQICLSVSNPALRDA